ncbi:alpha/beta hydrolase [Flavobacterium sp. 7A]|uniref:alpha/beta hydrolase n=1 Tax=Flavobacterium sp. 7A TaxID=2940571 RepID=UPI002227C641|nr:alpha/beta hydrolase [Flavobacterium sp. 7A]MCW2118967.1 hypothetical protein [Flavobacterium sp. 7A]
MEKIKLEIPLQFVTLKGKLVLPANATGIILFCSVSTSNTTKSGTKILSKLIQKRKMGTLVIPLLTKEEEDVLENKFDIDLLVSRLISSTEWLMQNKNLVDLPIGYLGTKMGAAAAMRAAAYFGKDIKAVVSRSGRPDKVLDTLYQITAPTLLIVDGTDVPIINRNKIAFDQLQSEKEMKIISISSNICTDSLKLQECAEVAISWFQKYLTMKETEPPLKTSAKTP